MVNSSNSSKKPILSVVEELKGLKLKDLEPGFKSPDFWMPYIPIKNKNVKEIVPDHYSFEFEDEFVLDPLGTLRKKVVSKGTIIVEDNGDQGSKGRLWVLTITTTEPEKSRLVVKIRARNLSNALKVGIFVSELEIDWSKVPGVTLDGILFAARGKLRDLLTEIQKRLKH